MPGGRGVRKRVLDKMLGVTQHTRIRLVNKELRRRKEEGLPGSEMVAARVHPEGKPRAGREIELVPDEVARELIARRGNLPKVNPKTDITKSGFFAELGIEGMDKDERRYKGKILATIRWETGLGKSNMVVSYLSRNSPMLERVRRIFNELGRIGEDYATTEEAAGRIGMTRQSVLAWVHYGDAPKIQVGRQYWIHRSVLERPEECRRRIREASGRKWLQDTKAKRRAKREREKGAEVNAAAENARAAKEASARTRAEETKARYLELETNFKNPQGFDPRAVHSFFVIMRGAGVQPERAGSCLRLIRDKKELETKIPYLADWLRKARTEGKIHFLDEIRRLVEDIIRERGGKQ